MKQRLPYREGNLVVIYDAHIVENHYRRNRLQKKAGYLFLTLFFLSTTFLIWPVITAKNFHHKIQITDSAITLKSPAPEEINNFNLSNWLSQRGIISIPDNNFSLIISKININTKVIPSVDLADKDATQKALKEGVVQAKDSSYPGQPGTISIFGHSTNSLWNIKLYNAIFYSLKDIEEGDEIIIIYKDNPFIYRVKEKKIVGANDLRYLISLWGEEKLILSTCWPPGTTWKRLLIIAIRT